MAFATTSDVQAIHAHWLGDMGMISLQEALDSEQTLLRIANPTPDTLLLLAKRFGLNALHVLDIQNPIHPPYLSEISDTCSHIVLRFPLSHTSDDVVSMSVIFDDQAVAIVWPGQRFHEFNPDEFKGRNIISVVEYIIHTVVNYLLGCVYDQREKMNEAEDKALANVNNADLAELLNMRQQMARYARLAMANGLVTERLLAYAHFHNGVMLEDANEHMNRANIIAEARAEHALNVLQATQSLLSQNLNQVMMFLAIITVILTPMGVIAGIFGMNFAQMEVLNEPLGFALTLWGMLILAMLTGILFKFKKWWSPACLDWHAHIKACTKQAIPKHIDH